MLNNCADSFNMHLGRVGGPELNSFDDRENQDPTDRARLYKGGWKILDGDDIRARFL